MLKIKKTLLGYIHLQKGNTASSKIKKIYNYFLNKSKRKVKINKLFK